MVLVKGWPNVRCSHDAACAGDFRIQHDVEVGLASRAEIGRRRPHRRNDVHVDAKLAEQRRDLDDVVAMAEAERGRAEQIAAGARRGTLRTRRSGRGR